MLSTYIDNLSLNADGTFASMEDAIKVLEILVGYDTSSSHKPELARSNVPFVKTLKRELDRLGVETLYTEEDEYPKGSGIMQATLTGKIGGNATKESSAPAGVVLSSHTDVVPAPGDWNGQDPFKLTSAEYGLVGRGAVDMKQAILNMLAVARLYEGRHDTLKEPVYFALSYGEEVGCQGVDRVCEKLTKQGCNPRMVIVNEPTGESVVYSHKGAAGLNIQITGIGGHSSEPEKLVNALHYAHDLLGFIIDYQSRLMKDSQYHDPHFDPPYPIVNAGTVTIGNSGNTIPAGATISLHLRTTPAMPLEKLMEPIQRRVAELDRLIRAEAEEKTPPDATLPEAKVSRTLVSNSRQLPVQNPEAVKAFAQIYAAVNEKEPKTQTVGFASDAGGFAFHFPSATTLVFGTGLLSQGAHAQNEFITPEQLKRGPQMLLAAIAETCLDRDKLVASKPDNRIIPFGSAPLVERTPGIQ